MYACDETYRNWGHCWKLCTSADEVLTPGPGFVKLGGWTHYISEWIWIAGQIIANILQICISCKHWTVAFSRGLHSPSTLLVNYILPAALKLLYMRFPGSLLACFSLHFASSIFSFHSISVYPSHTVCYDPYKVNKQDNNGAGEGQSQRGVVHIQAGPTKVNYFYKVMKSRLIFLCRHDEGKGQKGKR